MQEAVSRRRHAEVGHLAPEPASGAMRVYFRSTIRMPLVAL